MKCIGKYSKLISVLLLTVVMATGCGITDLLGTKNVVAEYEAENYNKDLYTGKLFASDLCVASGDISLSGISSDETNTLHSAALFDVDRKKVDFSYQMFDKIYPASTTKIMTALVALENADLSDVVTVSQNADMNSFAADEATCGIKAGDKITLSDLLYGLLLHSGNDNATAIAEYVGGSMDGFAEMMNKEAAKLMATGTHFVNSNGLHNDNHYTTAYDLYLIFNECIKHDDFVKIIMAKSHTAKVTGNDGTIRSITWEPTNFYATGDAKKPDNVTVIGGKTGTTQLAGNCLILLTKDKNDHPYISIVMKADTKPLLYKDMTAIVEAIPELMHKNMSQTLFIPKYTREVAGGKFSCIPKQKGHPNYGYPFFRMNFQFFHKG